MDDLYEDLENYNDLAELEELKKENQELKLKLADCDSRIEKLQKDFDKVSVEFKNLEINYSSLLKTAKAEIERKTQLISSLNAEKDNLVLNSLQSSNNNITNIRRILSRGRIDNVKKIANDTDDSSKKSLLLVDTRNRSLDRNRNDENCYPSMDTASSINTDDTNKFAKKTESLGVYQNTEVSKPMSIKDRRKSMPVVSQVKFSSDEEDNNSADDYNRTRPNLDPRKEDKRGFIPNRPLNEQPRDNYYDRRNRSERYGGVRKPQRYKRNFSPDRHRRLEDERHDKRRSRFDSPPLDRCDPRNRYRRSNYERDNFNDRYKLRHENYTFKPKIHGEYEEPSTKRARLDSNPHGDENLRPRRPPEFIEERVPSRNLQILQHETCQSPDYSNPDVVSPHPVREIKDNAATSLEDPRLSSNKYVKKCEGDKIILSTCSGRNVDLIPIEQSIWKQYKKEIPGAMQEMPKALQKIPEALQEMPSNAEELVKDIYMDIENPVSNMSYESGELLSETNVSARPDLFYERDELDRRSECRPNQTLTPHVGVPDNYDTLCNTTSIYDFTEQTLQKHNPITSIENTIEVRISCHENTTKYSIPKINTFNRTKSCTADKNPLALLMNEIQDAPSVVDFPDPIVKSKSLPPGKTTKLDVDTVFSRRQAEKKRKEKLNKKYTNQVKESRTSRDIVAGDLELSDETSDNIDLHNRIAVQSTNPKYEHKVNTKDSTKDIETVMKNQEKFEPKQSLPNLIENDINSQKIVKEHTDISSDKNKTKKKSQKKTAAKDTREEVTEKKSKCKEKVTEKKGKSKEKLVEKTSNATEGLPEKNSTSKVEGIEKISKLKDCKNSQKLYDLFGDSSSLITPEDLGLVPVADLDSVPYTSNLPLFEDAQHAMDIIEPKSMTTVIDPNKNQNIASKESTKPKNADSETTKTPNLFINVNPSDDDSGVVNTVIISSGVQSQVSNTHSLIPDVTETTEDHKNLHVLENQPVPIALATSTPHKNLLNILNEVETQTVDNSCSRNDIKEVQNDTSQSSISNGLDSHNVPDAPDVRIFVKRRKKFIKKN